MKIRLLYKISLLILTCLLASSPGYAGEVAGKVTFLKGKAWVQQGLAKNPLDTGSIVYSGDQIHTGRKTSLQMRFLDETRFTLGSEASMNIDSYDESDSAETSFATSILKGAFRFVSGLLARDKPKTVRVRVSVATIGIRGTDVAGEVFERRETDDGVIEASAKIMLMEDEDGKETAIEVFNEYGSVLIDQAGFGTEIPDEHSPPSPVRRMQIRTINNLMRAIRNSMRGNTQRRRLP